MQIDQLRTFVAVAKYQHVSRAAQELHMAQPAVSRHIRELERACGGVAIIEKVGRNVRLTEAGEALLLHAQSILAEVAAAEVAMKQRLGMSAGSVGVGTPPTVGLWALPDVLADFHRRHRAIELRIQQGSTSHLLHQLSLGDIDMAVVTLPVPERGHDIVELFAEPLMAVMHPDHVLAHLPMIDIGQLASEPLLLYPPGYEMHDLIINVYHEAGFEPKVVLDGGDVALLLRLAAAGLGITIVPQLALKDAPAVASVPIRHARMQRRVGIVTRSDRSLTPQALALRRVLIDALRAISLA